MVRIISALILAAVAACAFAQEKLQLVDNPPDRHIVVPGDTLWGISGKFLKEPWRWPEVWRLNKDQIKNPHRIYPGDIVVLDRSGGTPRLRIATPLKVQPQVYSEAIKKEIPSIPANIIEPFISRPLIVDADTLNEVPRIVASQEDRVFLGTGDQAFVTGIPDTSIIDWSIYRPGKPLKDPETNQTIGYEAFDLGSARLVQPGSPAVLKVTVAREEIGRGDRLAPAPKTDIISYVPHSPDFAIAARVVSIYGGLNEAGKFSVIALNRGTQDGLEVGHVLALHRHRVSMGYDENDKRVTTALPDERYGLIFVFRTFGKISYALVMDASKSVIVGDAIKKP
ncbi:MAG: LysM peptidoglycan-binding domain-containing protein [Betaproteobacteria bacterium]